MTASTIFSLLAIVSVLLAALSRDSDKSLLRTKDDIIAALETACGHNDRTIAAQREHIELLQRQLDARNPELP